MNQRTETILKKLKSKSNYSTKELCLKGTKIYGNLKQKLEPKLNNKFVAIEVESADYFIGNDAIEAINKAKKHYPDSVFFLARIGNISAFKARREIKIL